MLLAQNGAAVAQVDISGLELPQVLGISVTDGDPLSLGALQGSVAAPSTGATTGVAQVPIIPQECN